ncbi:fasciclin domain-containing protein [Qipengyuania aquimaris]|uniref:fasciclin domain-containing protein n=1 Tax=Qipengyuania aquimaris TaxID=255984 RepID=UPI001C97092A|nr:fasciclin domain-containing protein [Qipengyuania aquimaris]MBY6129366.1 fasciclin domain-containing protein [Qipengyuania aquimaris]
MMTNTFAKPLVLAGAIAGLALLPACSETQPGEATSETQEETSLTVAAALGGKPDLASLNGAVSNAQITSIFEGSASYTLLAPVDDAFAALGEQGQALMTEEQGPVLAGVLRDHILPGHLTPENIADAIENQGGEVKMTSFGGGEVTFSMDGDTIVATNSAGEEARFTGSATAATNGVIIPIDTVLLPGEAS